MPTVKHEAFLDLEDSLSARLGNAFNRHISSQLELIENAVADGEFDEAIDLVAGLDAAPPIERNQTFMTTVATAALFLGVSRVGEVKQSATFQDFPGEEVDAIVAQATQTLQQNATRDIQNRALQLIAQTEAVVNEETFTSSEEDETGFSPTTGAALAGVLGLAIAGATTPQQVQTLASKAIRVIVSRQGKSFMALGASLLVSRISAFGFLQEATAQGITRYMVSEILDSVICPICIEMNGKIFSVSDGLIHMSAILSTDDPEMQRILAPWPDQSKSGVDRISNMNNSTLVENGLLTPPYHPNCRGIVVALS